MKFPKSVHAEGWLDHIDTTAPEHLPDALKPGKNRFIKPADALAKPAMSAEPEGVQRPRVYMETPSEAPRPTISAPAAPVITARKSPSATPWVVGGGLAVVAIAVAMTMSHNLPSKDSTALPPTVTGEAKPSPEDAQIAAAPTAAGPVTPEAATPAVTPPVVEPQSTVVAAAPTPAPAPAPSPKVERAPAPVAKTLAPKPEVLAQASPQPVAPAMLPSTPQAQPTTPPPATVPEQATPTVPPVAQAQPTSDPAVADDAGVTVKVRTALATDAMLSAVPIAVSTDHGVVKLEGQVPDTQARERATVVAAATTGVKAVDNRLTLPPVALLQQLEPQVARAPSSN